MTEVEVSSDRAMSGQVMVVEDDQEQRDLLTRWLEEDGYTVACFGDAESAIDALPALLVDAVCLDLDLPGMDGLTALATLRRARSELPVIMLTATRDVDVVVKSMRSGAYDYLTKPVEKPRLHASLRNALEQRRMKLRITQLERDLAGSGFGGMLGRSRAMQAVFTQLDRASGTAVNVLVTGASGTGKTLVARTLHQATPLRDAPFAAFTTTAVPRERHEEALFGAGGTFEKAAGGTLVIDDVGELSPAAQARLLQHVSETPKAGEGAPRRLIATSSVNLADQVRSGAFREDLYYRLAVFEVELPELKDREDDISILATHFLAKFSAERALTLGADALEALRRYDWPGNVRELENTVQRAAMVSTEELVTLDQLPSRLRRLASSFPPPARTGVQPSAGAVRLRDLEKQALLEALERTGGNISQVVRELGIGRTTVYRKLKKYGLR